MGKTKTMVGIADAHGIESYEPAEFTNLNVLKLRADMNRQRHAVVYSVKVGLELDKKITDAIANDDFTGALDILKANENIIELKVAATGDAIGSWELIPNPKLDPYA